MDLCLFLVHCLALIIGLILERLKLRLCKSKEPENEKNNDNDDRENSEENTAEIPLTINYPSPNT